MPFNTHYTQNTHTELYLQQPGFEFAIQNYVKAQDLKADAVAPWWLAGATHAIGVQHMGLSHY